MSVSEYLDFETRPQSHVAMPIFQKFQDDGSKVVSQESHYCNKQHTKSDCYTTTLLGHPSPTDLLVLANCESRQDGVPSEAYEQAEDSQYTCLQTLSKGMLIYALTESMSIRDRHPSRY